MGIHPAFLVLVSRSRVRPLQVSLHISTKAPPAELCTHLLASLTSLILRTCCSSKSYVGAYLPVPILTVTDSGYTHVTGYGPSQSQTSNTPQRRTSTSSPTR